MGKAGFVPIPRDIEHTWVFSNPGNFRRFWILCSRAAFEDGQRRLGNQMHPVLEGQVVCRFKELMNLLEISNKALHTLLENLQEDDLIEYDINSSRTRITIWYLTKNGNRNSVKRCPNQKSPNQKNHPVEEYKEVKEINNQEEEKGKPPFSKKREEKFFNGLMANEALLGHLCQRHSIQQEKIVQYAKTFFDFIMDRAKSHNGAADFQEHFTNWLAIQIETEKNNITNESRNQQKSGGNLAGRRSADVSPVFSKPTEGETVF